MKEKAMLFAVLLALNAISENTEFGIGVGLNAVYTNVNFAPVPSLSFYLLKETCIHDLSAEYTRTKNDVEPEEETALIYSFLRYLPFKYFLQRGELDSLGPSKKGMITIHFLSGPSIGVLFSDYQNRSSAITWDNRCGRYFFGMKGMIKICQNHFGLTISDRLMLGVSRRNGPMPGIGWRFQIGVSNLLGAGLIIVL